MYCCRGRRALVWSNTPVCSDSTHVRLRTSGCRVSLEKLIQSTDHEFIPQAARVLRWCKFPRSEVMFITVQRENIRPSKKETNKAVTMLSKIQIARCFAVRLWITTSPYRWLIGSLPSTYMLWTPPHCTKGVYTPQGSTRDLWTVVVQRVRKFPDDVFVLGLTPCRLVGRYQRFGKIAL
jgi:hypothetical protein